MAAAVVEGGVSDGDRRHARRHDQPLPVLLADRAAGRGHERGRPRPPAGACAGTGPGEFTRIPIIGMAISNLVVLFIVITTAATLHAHGVTQIQTSAWAAEALRAVAGPLTFVVFAVGIIRTGMLALVGSAAYALARRSPATSAWPSAAACQGVLRDHRGGRGAGRGLNFCLHRSDPGVQWEHGDGSRSVFSCRSASRAFRMSFRPPDHRKILCGRWNHQAAMGCQLIA
jgi:hypothetical protein